MSSKKHCKHALEHFENDLISRANVVGLGITQVEEDKQGKGGFAVAVYVSKKLPKSSLSPKDLIPEYLEFKSRNKEYRVATDVIEIGEVGPEGFSVEM